MLRFRSALTAAVLAALAGSLMHCTKADPVAPPGKPVDTADTRLKILGPAHGARFKAADTVRIVTECDYARVAGNLSAVFSPDSGKTWELILSGAHGDGVVRDTFPFVPEEFGMAKGQSIPLRIKEYGTGGIQKDVGTIHID